MFSKPVFPLGYEPKNEFITPDGPTVLTYKDYLKDAVDFKKYKIECQMKNQKKKE